MITRHKSFQYLSYEMTLLEIISKASSAILTPPDKESNYPITLNFQAIFPNLKPINDDPQSENPVKAATGWEITQTDSQLAELGQSFFKKLKMKFKDTNLFSKVEFLQMFASHLEKLGEKVGILLHFDKPSEGNACKLVEKLGFLMGRDLKGLVLEGCVSFELWEVVRSLVVNGLVEHSCTSNLVRGLIEKRRSDLLVVCMKCIFDLQSYDIMCVLKYFLVVPGGEGYRSLVSVREDWERQARLAIERAGDKEISGKERSLAREAALLVMLAHDEFSVSELCLHYLLATPNVDNVIFSACVSKLNGEEIKALVQYLGKWLRKYERFPQVVPCPDAASVFGLEVCSWIPTLEIVVKCLGVVVDEHFSSLVMHSEFHELRALEGIVSSLAAEARLCGTLANLTKKLRTENQGMDRAVPFLL